MRLAWLWLLIPVATAHRPGGSASETEIGDPTISYVIPGTFETGDEVFVIELDMPRPFAAPFELLIPKRPGLSDHRPMYAVVGPDLPPAEASPHFDALPDELVDRLADEGWGAFVEGHDQPERRVYFEQVMRRNYWGTPTTALPLGEGLSELWVWSPEGTTGDFQIGFGVEEDFSNGGFTDIFANWAEYAY